MIYCSDRVGSCNSPRRIAGGIEKGFLSGGSSAELTLKEKLEISQVKKRGRSIQGVWWHTKAKMQERVVLWRSPS